MIKPAAGSLWVYHFAASSCSNCDMEILEIFTPGFDSERFGIKEALSIRHADCLLVTGVLNPKSLSLLKKVRGEAPRPVKVAAVGTCALDTGIFRGSYNVLKPLDKYIPVDLYIPGCPPTPEALLSGLLGLYGKDKPGPGKRRKGRWIF